jgi:hypothetical protein
MNTIIDIFFAYLNLLAYFAPGVLLTAGAIAFYLFYTEQKERSARRRAVLALAKQQGISYEEADMLVHNCPII